MVWRRLYSGMTVEETKVEGEKMDSEIFWKSAIEGGHKNIRNFIQHSSSF
jgi:hypothetical protein